MGKHFSDLELDQALTWRSQGMACNAIHKRLARARARARNTGPSLRAVQRAVKGVTFKRAKIETRGRKKLLTPCESPRIGSGSQALDRKGKWRV